MWLDTEDLARRCGAAWFEKDDRLCVEFNSQDGPYRMYFPEVHQRSDGGMEVTVDQDFIRSGTRDDHCRMTLVYDETGKLVSGKGNYVQGEDVQIPEIVFDVVGDLLDAVGQPELALIIEFAGKLTNFILGHIGEWTDGGGRPNFMAVVAHDINRISSSVRPQLDRVYIYQHRNYAGRSQALGPGRYDASLVLPNDSISSIEVPPGWRARLYADEGFGGSSRDYTSSTDWLGDSNDVTSSIEIFGPSDRVILYTHSACKGPSQDVFPGRLDAAEIAIGAHETSSVWVPPGMRATLYDQPGFHGSTCVLKGLTLNLKDLDFNDKAASVIVEGTP